MVPLLLSAAGELGWVPAWAHDRSFAGLETWQWLGAVLALMVATGASLLLQQIALWIGRRLARLTATTWDDELVEAGNGPLGLLLFSGLLYLASLPLRLPEGGQRAVETISQSLLIVSVAWFLHRFLRASSVALQAKVSTGVDELRIRGLRTQLLVMRSVLQVAIYAVAGALLLMQFQRARSLGVSLLASAGIAGLVLGLAAQKSISSLLAGIQLSITQPVRIGDSVVVEGEFGEIEEITLTYVVVKVWDLRRLVIPISYFLEKPFENWTRSSTDLLGTVTLDADYTVDVEAFRAELKRILEGEGKPLWDGKASGMVVTDAGRETVTLRALVSAAQAEALWDLRCLVRERLLSFLTGHPEWLPQRRSSPYGGGMGALRDPRWKARPHPPPRRR